jgi:hypothetical protein
VLESIFGSSDAAVNLSLESGILAIVVAVLMGAGLSAAYILLQNGNREAAKAFATTLIILPAVITIIVALVGNNVARAFSIAGIFSIIRFRSLQMGPKELAFVLLAMAVGLGCGMGYIIYAVVFGLILAAVAIGAQYIFSSRDETKILKVFIPESLDHGDNLDKVIAKYTKSSALIQSKTADLGSLYKLTYRVVLRRETDVKKMIDDIRTKNGNLTISLTNTHEMLEK